MKRHPGLVPLSHDHHHGLVHASRLNRAAAGERDLDAAVDDFLAFYPVDLLRHFREEEEVLGPLMAERFGDQDAQRVRLFGEHGEFHALVRALRAARETGDGFAEAAGAVGAFLEAHIRFEERELFPRLQDDLSDDELMALAPRFSGGPPTGA